MSRTSTVFPSDKEITYTNWGRSALEAVFRADDLTGGTVLLPAFICQTSFSRLFERVDLTPVFVDIDPETYEIDPEHAQEHIDQVDAAVVVHPFGFPAQIDVWTDLCAEHDVVLVEDCVRALGAQYNGRVVGDFGDHAVYSLHKTAPVARGGAVASVGNPRGYLGDPVYDAFSLYHALPAHTREVVSLSYPTEYELRRLDELTRQEFISFLSTQFDDHVAALEDRAARLRESLEPLGFQFQPKSSGRRSFLIPALAPGGTDRNDLMDYVRANVDHSPLKVVWPNPWAKSYAGNAFERRYPATKEVSDRILCFKVRLMDDATVESTIDTIHSFMRTFPS